MVKGRGTTELREEQLLFWPEEGAQSAKRGKQPQKLQRKSRIAEIRYENLCYLIDSKFQGSVNLLAAKIGTTSSARINDVLSAGATRLPVSSKLARRIEQTCGLEALSLDKKQVEPKQLARKIELLDLRARLALQSVVNALVENTTS